LTLQLRKRRISKILLGGMLANICVESHLRDLLEQGFEVAVVKDATAGPRDRRSGRAHAPGGAMRARLLRLNVGLSCDVSNFRNEAWAGVANGTVEGRLWGVCHERTV
jgi:hypothetical protein